MLGDFHSHLLLVCGTTVQGKRGLTAKGRGQKMSHTHMPCCFNRDVLTGEVITAIDALKRAIRALDAAQLPVAATYADHAIQLCGEQLEIKRRLDSPY